MTASRFTNSQGGAWVNHPRPDPGRTRNDGARLDTGKRMSRRETGFWLGLFAGITVGGLGASLYFSEPPVASDAAPASSTTHHGAVEAGAMATGGEG